MAWTQADVDAVDTAIRSLIAGKPLQRLVVGGADYTFLTLKELRDLRAEMALEAGLAGGGSATGFVRFRAPS
jgi:hypothetical protein